jgi:hypothetical protein
MLKNAAAIAFHIGENVYHFLSAPNGSYSEIKEALSQFMAHVISLENQWKAAQDQQAAQAAEKPVEAVPVPEQKPAE